MAPGETLLVLATDPEAPIDLAALAGEEGHAFTLSERAGELRMTLTKVSAVS